MDGKYDVRLTSLELENIKLALIKRAYSMETYLIRSNDLVKEPVLRRDIDVSRELAKRIEEIMKNGSRTWSA